jgi:hypothetical protein
MELDDADLEINDDQIADRTATSWHFRPFSLSFSLS